MTPRPMGIGLQEAKPEDTLARDVVDANGTVLMRTGSSLTESAIVQLANRNIKEIWVERSIVLDPEVVKQKLDEIRNRLDQQFSLMDISPSVQGLKAMLWRFHTRELMNDE